MFYVTQVGSGIGWSLKHVSSETVFSFGCQKQSPRQFDIVGCQQSPQKRMNHCLYVGKWPQKVSLFCCCRKWPSKTGTFFKTNWYAFCLSKITPSKTNLFFIGNCTLLKLVRFFCVSQNWYGFPKWGHLWITTFLTKKRLGFEKKGLILRG